MNLETLLASEKKIIESQFYNSVRVLEMWIEKNNFYSDWQIRGQIKDRFEESWGKIWKDKSLLEIKKLLTTWLVSLKVVFEINKEKNGFPETNEKIKQDFYRWIHAVKIEKILPNDLKSILLVFYEILEGRGDEWFEKTIAESEKEMASWSKEKLKHEMEKGFSAVNQQIYEIKKENEDLVEGKNWNEITIQNRFINGDAERGKQVLLQIVSSKNSSNQSQNLQYQNQNPSKFQWWWIVPTGILVLVIGIVVFYWVKKSKKAK